LFNFTNGDQATGLETNYQHIKHPLYNQHNVLLYQSFRHCSCFSDHASFSLLISNNQKQLRCKDMKYILYKQILYLLFILIGLMM
jgi:hypothetical protein